MSVMVGFLPWVNRVGGIARAQGWVGRPTAELPTAPNKRKATAPGAKRAGSAILESPMGRGIWLRAVAVALLVAMPALARPPRGRAPVKQKPVKEPPAASAEPAAEPAAPAAAAETTVKAAEPKPKKK